MSAPPLKLKFGSAPPRRPASRGGDAETISNIPQRNLPGRSFAPSGKISNPAVKEMQIAISNFSRALSSVSFGDFLTNHYIEKKENNPTNTNNIPNQYNATLNNTSFNTIVNEISRIGTPGSENKPDGIWMEKTNAALHQIYNVGKGILNFANDLGIPINGFSEKQWDDFGSNIPKSYIDIKDKEIEIYANAFTRYINVLTQIVNQFSKYISQNKEYSSYLNEEKSINKYDSEPELTADEQKLLQNNMKTPIPGVNVEVPGENGKTGTTIPVALENISSIENFKTFLKSLHINADDPRTLNSYITSIKSKMPDTMEEAATGNPGY